MCVSCGLDQWFSIAPSLGFARPNFDGICNYILSMLISKNILVTNAIQYEIGLNTRAFRVKKNREAPDSCPVSRVHATAPAFDMSQSVWSRKAFCSKVF